MVLFRHLFSAVLFLGLVVGGVVGGVQEVSANQCSCGCAYPGSGSGATNGNGPTCTSDAQCTQAACAMYCSSQGPGVVPGRLTNGRVYSCADYETAFSLPTPPPPAPAPAPARGFVPEVGGGGAGVTSPAAPSGGGRTTGGAAASARTGAAAGTSAPAASGASFRFELPACTENGQCSLTDIINTGVRFANFLLALSGVVFLGTFLYAGANLLFFAYETKQIDTAKKMITGAFVGIVIIMVAGVGVRFVSSALGVGSSFTRLPGSTAPRTTTPAATPR